MTAITFSLAEGGKSSPSGSVSHESREGQKLSLPLDTHLKPMKENFTFQPMCMQIGAAKGSKSPACNCVGIGTGEEWN